MNAQIRSLICLMLLGALLGHFEEIAHSTEPAKSHAFDARLKSIQLPDFVNPGERFRATISLQNTGSETWNEKVSPVWLGANNTIPWAANRVSSGTPSNHKVPPGELATFSFECTAPTHPGVYPFSWSMVAENVTWFGESAQKIITVSTNQSSASTMAREFDFRSWQTEDGLPHNTIHALLQTRDGYLWIGTQAGLTRFDGVRFKTWDDGGVAVGKVSVSSLAEDLAGTLWIGTFDNGLIRYKDGSFSSFFKKDGLINDSIRSLYCAPDGAVWIGTTNGLSRFNNGTFKNAGVTDGLPHSMIRAIGADAAGDVWLGTSANGVCRFKDGKIAEVVTDQLPRPSIRAIYRDRQSNLWFGGYGGAFYKTADRYVSFTRQDGLPHDIVTAICQDRTGSYWIGSYGGVTHLQQGKWRMELDNRSVSLDSVSSILEDRDGNIWSGTKDGLVRFKPKRFFTYTQQHGLTHNNVMSVQGDAAGNIWIGTWGGGLNRLQEGKIDTFTKGNGLSLDLVLGLHVDRSQRLWVGTDFEGGLNRMTAGTFEQWKLPDSSLRVIHEGEDGVLWLGTSHSLIEWKDGVRRRFTTAEGLRGPTVRSLCDDGNGGLWIGTSGGLNRLAGNVIENIQAIPTATVLSLYRDLAKEILWMGTAGNGLFLLDQGQVVACNSANGLFSDDIFEIVEDDYSRIWMSSPRGIFCVNKSEIEALFKNPRGRIHCIAFGKSDGLESLQCNGVAKPSAWKSKDGRLWFATTKGLSVIKPEARLRYKNDPPNVVVEELVADKKRFPGPSDEFSTRPISLPPGRGELEITYTALSFLAPERNQFRYKLEGFDRDWTHAGTRRFAYYNNLAPGDYTFRVQACNSDGLWNEAGTSVAITLQPQFWQTWWFVGVGGLAGVVLVGGGARTLTRRKMQRQLAALEQRHAIERERTRIARDMHDDLGAHLTEIVLLGNLAAHSNASVDVVRAQSGKIASSANELVRNLDAIVWAVDPQKDTLESLAFYLQEFVELFLASTGFRFRLDVPADLPNQSIPSEVRHNLFLTAKEALNNAVKYSNATCIQVGLRFDEPTLSIWIEDDGKGFSREGARQSGNGLQNMEDRIKAINGKFTLRSAPGQGTRAEFKVRLMTGSSDGGSP